MKLPKINSRFVISAISIPLIFLAVFAAGGDAVLGLQTLLPVFGLSSGVGFIIICLVAAIIVAFLYFIQDGLSLWRSWRAAKEEAEVEAEAKPQEITENQSPELEPQLSTAEKTETSEAETTRLLQKGGHTALVANKTVTAKAKPSVWRAGLQAFKVFWLAEEDRPRGYRVANFIGRLISLVGAFAASGGAYLAIQTLLAFFGVNAGIGGLVLCSLCALAVAFAFVTQDGFSLLEKLREFTETVSTFWQKLDQEVKTHLVSLGFETRRINLGQYYGAVLTILMQRVGNYFRALTVRKVMMGLLKLSLVAMAAFAATGDAFLGVKILFVNMSLSLPQVILVFSVTFAVFLGIIYLAQEGFSLANMLTKLVNKFTGHAAENQLSAQEVYVVKGWTKVRVLGVSLILSVIAGFAVAGGAYLGLNLLLLGLGLSGQALIAISATAALFGGIAYMTQDGAKFYKLLCERFGKKIEPVPEVSELPSSERQPATALTTPSIAQWAPAAAPPVLSPPPPLTEMEQTEEMKVSQGRPKQA